MAKIIRAISIRQPYVEQILRGIKKAEYRSQPTRIRERVYLYASVRPGEEKDWKKVGKLKGELPTGVIVGTIEIAGCRFNKRLGCYEFVLRAPRRLRRKLTPLNQPQPRFWRPIFKR